MVLEIETGSTRSQSVENSFWKRLRTSRKIDYWMMTDTLSGLRPLLFWHHQFESRWGKGCPSLVFVVSSSLWPSKNTCRLKIQQYNCPCTSTFSRTSHHLYHCKRRRLLLHVITHNETEAYTYTTKTNIRHTFMPPSVLFRVFFYSVHHPYLLFALTFLRVAFLSLLTTHKTNIHAPGEIRTRNPNKRSSADPRLRPHGHRDRRKII
jgi:hypothetical protein